MQKACTLERVQARTLLRRGKDDVKEIFREEVESNMAGKAEDTVEKIWNCIKGSMVKAANKVCGMTKGKPARCRKTWWWSEEVSKAVKAKRRLFINARKSKSNVDKAASKVAKNENKIQCGQGSL